jgi:hypothetical protein
MGMSDKRVLTLDDLWRYCLSSNDVLFSKDRGSGIFVTRYGFYHEGFPEKVYVWILYHPLSNEPLQSVLNVLRELRGCERFCVVDDRTGGDVVLVVCRRFLRKYVVKYGVSKYKVLLPGDLLMNISEWYYFLPLTLHYREDGEEYVGYFALVINQALDLVGLDEYPPAIHILLVNGAFRVASVLSSVSLPTVDEVVKNELLEDFKELLSLKCTQFALKEIEKLYKALAEEKK